MYLFLIFSLFMFNVSAFYPYKTGYYYLKYNNFDNLYKTSYPLEINNNRYRETIFKDSMHFASKFRKFVNYTFQVNNLPIYPEIVYIEPLKIINNQCLLSNKDILIFPNKSMD